MPVAFAPADIVAATNGRIAMADLRNWVRDGWFNTRLREPRAGKPREFPELAVYEAVLLSEFSAYGVPMKRAKAWNAEIIGRIAKAGIAVIDEAGYQHAASGVPRNAGPPPQIVAFHRDAETPIIWTDSEAGETTNLLFYKRRSPGPAPSLAAIHLPALLSPIRRALKIAD